MRKSVLNVPTYRDRSDYEKVEESFITFLTKSVEKRVIPRVIKLQRKKQEGAIKALRHIIL